MKKSIIVAALGATVALTACGQETGAGGVLENAQEEAQDAIGTVQGIAKEVQAIVEEATPLSDGSAVLDAAISGEGFYDGPLRVLTVILDGGGDAETLEGNGFSPDYYTMVQDSEEGLSRVGYAVFDLNSDGVPELFIGDRDSSMIYDIYTIVNGEPEQVVSGGARNRYYLQGEDWFCNEYSNGAAEFGWNVYALAPGSKELLFQWGCKYDAYEHEENPWLSTDVNDEWKLITEKAFNRAVEAQNANFKEIDFKPLSDWGK